jgi:GDP-L-fucose synthase
MNKGFWNGKTVLITGAHGFVGRNLVSYMSSLDCELLTPTRKELDLTCQKQTSDFFSSKSIDVVIHLAGLVGGIAVNNSRLGDFFYQNAIVGINTLHYSYVSGVQKFVGLAAGCGYPDVTIPFKESDFLSGFPDSNSYGYSMAKKNLVIQSWAYRDQYGFDSTMLIPANLYGPHDNFDLETSHVVPALVRKFIEAEDEVVVWGSGKASREFIYVEDVCKSIVECCEIKDLRGPYNLGTGVETTIKELIEALSIVTGFEGKVVWDSSRPDGQQRRYYDMSEFKNNIGEVPSTPLLEGVQKTVDWYKSEH